MQLDRIAVGSKAISTPSTSLRVTSYNVTVGPWRVECFRGPTMLRDRVPWPVMVRRRPASPGQVRPCFVSSHPGTCAHRPVISTASEPQIPLSFVGSWTCIHMRTCLMSYGCRGTRLLLTCAATTGSAMTLSSVTKHTLTFTDAHGLYGPKWVFKPFHACQPLAESAVSSLWWLAVSY